VPGIQKGQLDGVRDPKANLIEKLDVKEGDFIRRLAESYLGQSINPAIDRLNGKGANS
jgi:hypothetical protein